MGYECVGIQDGGIRRMRKINVWRKNKQTGPVTQFVRGKAMRNYRAMIVKADGTPASDSSHNDEMTSPRLTKKNIQNEHD